MAWLEVRRPLPAPMPAWRIPPPAPIGGMGMWAEAVAAILGPLVEGGVSAYGVYSGNKAQKDELRSRRQEVLVQQQAQQEAQKSQERQFLLAQQGAVQQAQIASATSQRNWPYITAAIGLGALALITVGGVKYAQSRRKK